MKTADLLELLKEHDRGFLSGEELSSRLGVSRTAVWKHIHQLEESGYRIAAVPHQGYRLLESPDRLLPDEIRSGLKTQWLGHELVCFNETTSTNDRAMELAAGGAREGMLVAAESQTHGRGRYQRSWLSKSHSNLLFSIVLRPPWTFDQIPMITLLLAVAVARAIQAHTGLAAQIKWPNDILIHGSKVSGILTEMRTQADLIHFVICGIGINVNHTPSGALKTKAASLASLTGKPLARLPLLRTLLLEIETWYSLAKKKGLQVVLEQWHRYSCTPPGTPLKLEVAGGEKVEGTAMGIDESGALLVRMENGITRRFASGEVQVQIS